MIVEKYEITKNLNLILKIHNKIISKTGGEFAIRDEEGLYNSVYRILYYKYKNISEPFKIAAFILLELGRRHHFFDGNKRTAYLFSKLILTTLGYHLVADYKEASSIIIIYIDFNSNLTIKNLVFWFKENSITINVAELENYLKEFYLKYL